MVHLKSYEGLFGGDKFNLESVINDVFKFLKSEYNIDLNSLPPWLHSTLNSRNKRSDKDIFRKTWIFQYSERSIGLSLKESQRSLVSKFFTSKKYYIRVRFMDLNISNPKVYLEYGGKEDGIYAEIGSFEKLNPIDKIGEDVYVAIESLKDYIDLH